MPSLPTLPTRNSLALIFNKILVVICGYLGWQFDIDPEYVYAVIAALVSGDIAFFFRKEGRDENPSSRPSEARYRESVSSRSQTKKEAPSYQPEHKAMKSLAEAGAPTPQRTHPRTASKSYSPMDEALESIDRNLQDTPAPTAPNLSFPIQQ